MALISDSGIPRDAAIIDVGGGALTLVDYLLTAGYTDVTVLDIAGEALAKARARLDAESVARVHWVEAADTHFVPQRCYALWHDHAVFHFLTAEAARAAYRETLHRALAPDGSAVIATFAADGPTHWSGLDVARMMQVNSPRHWAATSHGPKPSIKTRSHRPEARSR